MNNDVANIVRFFWVDMFLFILDRYLRVELLGHTETHFKLGHFLSGCCEEYSDYLT